MHKVAYKTIKYNYFKLNFYEPNTVINKDINKSKFLEELINPTKTYKDRRTIFPLFYYHVFYDPPAKVHIKYHKSLCVCV